MIGRSAGGIAKRIGRPGKAAVLLAAGAIGGGVAVAVAAVPGSDGGITACVDVSNTGTVQLPVTTGANLEIIDPAAGQSCVAPVTKGMSTGPGQTTLSFDQTGPQGATGPAGQVGPPGPTGTTATVISGSTLTLPNREVITVGGSDLPAAPVTGKGRSLGTATIMWPKQGSVSGSGKNTSSSSFNITSFSFGTESPVDNSSGLPSGKRQHGPIVVTKQVDPASPLLLNALARDELLKQVRISLSDGAGKHEVIDLTNAVLEYVGRPPTGKGESQTETLSFTFQKIELAYVK